MISMEKELAGMLVCPVCRGKLELTVVEETDEGVVSGALRCVACNVRYPVTDAIPNLLPPER